MQAEKAGKRPLDMRWTERDFPRMDVTHLLRRIDLQLASAGISERAACLATHKIDPDVNVDFVRDIRRRGHDPKVGKLMAFASAIGTDLFSLLADYPAAQAGLRREADDVAYAAVATSGVKSKVPLDALVAALGSPEKGEVVKEPSELALLRFWRSLDEREKREVIGLLSR